MVIGLYHIMQKTGAKALMEIKMKKENKIGIKKQTILHIIQ